MITFRVSAEVKDHHRVELTLPPEVPVGRADLVVTVSPQEAKHSRRSRSSLADWAEQHAENWGQQLDATDVAGFTGRRF
jgi:hypothetical protein